jgi:hypothetical protein
VYRTTDVEEGRATFRFVWVASVNLSKIGEGKAVTLKVTAQNWNGFLPGKVLIGFPARAYDRNVSLSLFLPAPIDDERIFEAMKRREQTKDAGARPEPCAAPECRITTDRRAGLVTLNMTPAHSEVSYALFWNMPSR